MESRPHYTDAHRQPAGPAKMGCSGSKPSEERKKDSAANALQLAASGYLRGKEAKAAADKTKAEEEERLAREQREAEAAKLLQRAASAHLALTDPLKPPGLNIPTDNNEKNVVENVIDTARGLMEGLFKGMAGDNEGGGAKPPGLNIPANDGGENLLEKGLSSARALLGLDKPADSKPAARSAEDLAAELEAQQQQPPQDEGTAPAPPVAAAAASPALALAPAPPVIDTSTTDPGDVTYREYVATGAAATTISPPAAPAAPDPPAHSEAESTAPPPPPPPVAATAAATDATETKQVL